MGSIESDAWRDLPKVLSSGLDKYKSLLLSDPQFQAFVVSKAVPKEITFGIKSSGSDNTILVTAGGPKPAQVDTGNPSQASFILSALPEQWEQFFKPNPVAPYQSYWGMFGMNIQLKGIEILGDQGEFSRFTHFWRRALELLHDAYCGPMGIEDEEPETDVDYIVGRYVYVKSPIWGRCKVFYEQSGEGKQDIVFLHTAGSDSRQYHGVMNDERMRKACNMIAFDLPGHGRSFPSELPAGAHTNTEESYVGCITAMIKALKLNKPIVCGASMAGQVCLAVAIHADEVGAGGVIPMQGCDFLTMERQWDDHSPFVNQSLYNPEWVYGMMCPTAPLKNRQLIWHLYSAQAYGIFHGDLDFYFGGWDGRSRMAGIDTKKCPVFMLTGEYDWSNTPAMAQATADKIPGAKAKAMPQLGHFPATENPRKFVPHLLEAIEHIQKTRA